MNALLGWLIESGWQAAVMALIISLVLLAACGRIPPKWRYALWLLVVLRLLLPALPEARMSAYRVVPASPSQAWEAALPAQPAPEWMESRAEPSFIPPHRRGVDWRVVLAWLWLGGAAGFGGWLIFRQAAFSWHYRRTRQRPSPELGEILSLAARRAGLRRAPELWVMPGINGAALSGLIRPVIVAPPELERTLDRQRLELVLLHECVHLRRGDMWTHAAAVIAGVMHWWNPVVWWLRGRLQAERELATDAAVLECLEQREQLLYGETLLELATQPSAGRSTLQPSLGLLERHGDLRQRMVQISSFSRATMVWSMAGVVLLVGLAVVLLVRQAEPPLEPLPTGERESIAVNQDFYEAVRKGDMRKVKEYLRRGFQINNTEGTNALFWAIHARNLAMVRYLIAHGVPLNEVDGGDTAINHACWVGDKVILDTMIAAGAKCDPYSYAISTGDIAALDKKQAEKPMTKDELMVGMCMATAANAASNDWFWAHLSPLLTPEEKANWLGERFVNTAFWGRLDMMQDVEKMGVDFQKYGPAALSSAISHGHLPMAKYLLGRGGVLSEPKPNSAGPLRNAAGEGQVELVKFLLDHGADINARDGQGLTPLAWAISNRRVEVCRLLLDRGADVSLKNEWGQTALWSAASGGMQPEIVELLLRHGADPRGVDKSGEPILTAMQGVYFPRKGKVGYPGKIYTEEEIKEWKVSVRKTVELLIQAGADPNAPGGFYGTPLIAAISNGQSAIAEALIEHGAEINQRDEKGNAPIAFFFRDGQSAGVDASLLQSLLDRGADPNSNFTEPHTTPVPPPTPVITMSLYMAAAQQNEPELLAQTRRAVAMLLQHGAKFPVPGDARGSKWIAAAATGDLKRMKQLHADGVDLNTTMSISHGRNWNALSVAMAFGNNEAADWLMQQPDMALAPEGASAWSPLGLAVRRQDLALVQKFLAAGIKPNAEDMASAAYAGNTKVFTLLRQAGGDASQVNLRFIIEHDNLDILKMALDSGAAAHQKSRFTDSDGIPENTDPVYSAVENNKPEALKLLLQYNLPPNLKDPKGETPLDYAKKWRRLPLQSMLEEAIKRATPAPTPTP